MGRICNGCGGVLGRDCYNEADCVQISQQMNSQEDIQPLMDVLKQCESAIKWMCDNMDVIDPNMHETYYNLQANALQSLRNVIPKEPEPFDWSNLPF